MHLLQDSAFPHKMRGRSKSLRGYELWRSDHLQPRVTPSNTNFFMCALSSSSPKRNPSHPRPPSTLFFLRLSVSSFDSTNYSSLKVDNSKWLQQGTVSARSSIDRKSSTQPMRTNPRSLRPIRFYELYYGTETLFCKTWKEVCFLCSRVLIHSRQMSEGTKPVNLFPPIEKRIIQSG